jgi:DNA-binding SARP family transcriptional activator
VNTEAPLLSLHVLASPQLLRDGLPVHVGSRKALAILAWLALEGGSARARLTSLLWPEADAAAGRRNLRRELFRLRELGAPLREAADGTLALDAGLEVDALRLLEDDRLPDGGGLAFDGLDGVGSGELDAWLQRWRDRLAAHQAQALDRQATTCESRGDLATALALRQRGWAADALQEAAALHVMRLKAALGDRAGALQAYQRLQEALRDELDIAPSPPVQAFARTLRDGAGETALPTAPPLSPAEAGPHPALEAAASVAARSGLPAVVPFVPRTAVQRQVELAWARGQRVYLHGPAGAGKTRLASEIAATRGPWLRVACEPQDVELPYASVVRLLRALRDSAPDVAYPDWVRRELAQLMPELGAPPPTVPTEEARQRLLAAVAEAWRLLMHDNFSAIVLDDWHWGDPASVELWARLDAAEVPAAARAAWIIGYRSAQLPVAALARQRADLDSGHAVAVLLEGMDEAEVLALTQQLSGAPGGRLFSQRLHRATEGNPFFLLETLRHLFEQGLLSADAGGWSTPFDEDTESYAELPVPPSVRAAVQARVRALGLPVQRLLEVASLGSDKIETGLVAKVGGLDEERAVAALEHAAAAQLVLETGTGWRFVHDLVRQSLVLGLSPGRQRLLHERLAQHMERGGFAPALIAAQWEAAQRPAAAVRWRVAAAEAALHVHAPDEALANYAQALANGATGSAAAAIHLACAEVRRRRSDTAAADDAFAAAVLASAGDPRAAPSELLRVRLAQAEHLCTTDRIDAGLAALDALAPEFATATPELRARVLAVRGAGLIRQSRFSDGAALLTDAVALLEGRHDSRRELAGLLLDLARANNWRGEMEAWGRYARRAVAAYESVDDRAGLAAALGLLALFHKYKGEAADALAVGERARTLAAHSGDVSAQRIAIFYLVQTLMDSGHTERVLVLLDEGEALAPTFENRQIELNYQAARFFVHFLRGEVDAARQAGDRLLANSKRVMQPLRRVGYLHLMADLHIDLGEWSAVRALIDEAQAACDAQKAGGEQIWFLSNQAVKQAMLALAEGRPAVALGLLPVDDEEVDIRFHVAYLGAAAARAMGERPAALRWLERVDLDEHAPAHPLACCLEQRLLLAAELGHCDVDAAARAGVMLAEGRVPALIVGRLRRALDAAPR